MAPQTPQPSERPGKAVALLYFTLAPARCLTGRRCMMAKRILVPLSTSEHADAVLPLVADLARAAGATVRLLHVTPYSRTRFSPDDRVIHYAHQQEERDAREAEDWLRDLARRLDGIAVEHGVRT